MSQPQPIQCVFVSRYSKATYYTKKNIFFHGIFGNRMRVKHESTDSTNVIWMFWRANLRKNTRRFSKK